MIPSSADAPSTRPYLIRALYEWCTDHGFTPYVAVLVDDSVQVPREYVRNGEIVLNISPEATSALRLGNEYIEFKARFAGTARDIMVPVDRVIAIYARENGQGMAFPTPQAATSAGPAPHVAAAAPLAAPSAAPGSAPAPERRPAEGRPVQLVSTASATADDDTSGADSSTEPEPPRPAGGSRPALKRIK